MSRQIVSRAPLAAADPSTAGQARLCAGQGVAAAAGAGRGDGQELGLCAASQWRDAGGLRLAGRGDRRARRRGLRLRSRAGRRPARRRVAGAVRSPRATRIMRVSPQKRASSPRASTARAPDGELAEIATRRRACASSSSEIVAIDFFGADGREPAEGLVVRPRGRLQQEERSHDRRTRPHPRRRRSKEHGLGDAPGRAGRPHRLGLADPPLHRPGGALQVRAGHRLRAASRASCASTCSRASSPTRATAAPSRCCWPRRPRRSGPRAPSARSSTTST